MLSPSSHLDRDLGLGSLERVELLARLESEFAVRLPDRVAAEINTPEDLAEAVLSAPGKNQAYDAAPSALRASIAAEQLHRAAPVEGIFAAQTLLDVLRYRAMHDADRTHLRIAEDSDTDDKTITLTFSELYSAAQSCAAELARLAVPPDGPASLILPSSPSFFACYAGILYASAHSLPS